MKTTGFLLASALSVCSWAQAQTSLDYTNFIRQTQQPDDTVWDMPVAAAGQQLSALAINPGGAKFDLWTINTITAAEYLLETRYVGAYVPVADVVVRSEDPYDVIPRTRADRPFYVDLVVNGLLSGVDDPEPSKKIKFLRHVQSYGVAGTGYNIDRTQAALLSQTYVDVNGTSTMTFEINSVPGGDRAKVRGEERFSAFSLEDYQAPESQLGSRFIQIWPVADGAISGISNNQAIRFKMPDITIALNDLYPDSHTYAQVYKGAPQLGRVGAIVPGSSLLIKDAVPQDRVLTLSAYDQVFDDDGQWTMELVTATPFGLDRLTYLTFTLNRTLQMNGTVTTVD
jgi:hypothetical protein